MNACMYNQCICVYLLLGNMNLNAHRDQNPTGVQHNSLNVEVKKRKFADETLVEMPGFWTAFEVCVKSMYLCTGGGLYKF